MIYISTVKTLPEIPELDEEDSLYIMYKNTETVKMADVEILCNMLSKKHFEEFEDKNDMLVVFGIILSQLKEDEDCILVDNTLPVPKRFEDHVKKLAKQTKTAKKKSTAKRTAKKKPVAEVTASQDMSERTDQLVGVPEEAWKGDEIVFESETPDDQLVGVPEEAWGIDEIAFGDTESEKTLDKPTEIKDEPMEIAFGIEGPEEIPTEPEKLAEAELEEPEDIFDDSIDGPTSIPDDAPEKLQELIKADAPDDYPFPVSMFYMNVAQAIANAKSDSEIETELTAINNGKDSLWKKTKPVLTKAKKIVGK